MLGSTRCGDPAEELDGRYTGEISFYAYAENKAAEVRRLCRGEGLRPEPCWAYSDSITDVSMLEAVGQPARGQPRQGPASRGPRARWPILVFDKPVALAQPGAPAPTTPTLAALAGAAGAAAVGAAWWLGARRRRAGS